MHKYKLLISVFFLILFLFPVGEKIIHDIEHLSIKHCNEQQTHFCQTDHSCAICKFTLSKCFGQVVNAHNLFIISSFIDLISDDLISNTIIPLLYTFSIRGPPSS